MDHLREVDVSSDRAKESDHQWIERQAPHFKLDTGETVAHQQCLRCGRDFVTVLYSGNRYAVHVGAFVFYRFDDEVTERWLSEPCPGKRSPADDEDRNSQIVKILALDEDSRRSRPFWKSGSSAPNSTTKRRTRARRSGS
jgi:hypothetical protein